MVDRAALRECVVGVLGGTGAQGKGLVRRFAEQGLDVLLGSRSESRAQQVAQQLTEQIGTSGVRGADNRTCARAADIAVVAVPWAGHRELLRSLEAELAGTVVVDCVNPIGFDQDGPYALSVEEGSAAQQAQALLPRSRVVVALNHISAVHLDDPVAKSIEGDVLVLGDDREAVDLVRELVEVIPGLRGVYAGRLRNAGQVEALTANLISVNRRYRTSAGIRVTGV